MRLLPLKVRGSFGSYCCTYLHRCTALASSKLQPLIGRASIKFLQPDFDAGSYIKHVEGVRGDKEAYKKKLRARRFSKSPSRGERRAS